MTIVLIGYMGSGKSTIGRKLSLKLNYTFIDLDTFIEKKVGLEVKDIFDKKGEIYFRKLEMKYLSEVLSIEDSIISLGGGTPCYGDNMKRIKDSDNIKSVYLQTSIDELVERLFSERHARPLINHLNSKDELIEFVAKHLFERRSFYSQSDLTITTDGKDVNEISEELSSALF